MSTMVKEKKPFLPQRKSAPAPAGSTGSALALTPSRAAASANALVIGGEPRVHLLPLEVTERKKSKALQRRLAIGAIAVVLITGAAYGATAFSLATTQTQLEAAQAQTAQLVTQQGKYGQVQKVKSDIAAIQAAQKTATSQEILWQPYVLAIQNSLPAGASITSFAAAINAPLGGTGSAAAAQPLVGPHIATLNLTLSMPETSIAPWLNTLPSIKGFVDATPDSVTAPQTGGSYTVVVTMDLDTNALSNRFTKAAGTNK
jgi:hypothetical protein